jgi:hypothetical protein
MRGGITSPLAGNVIGCTVRKRRSDERGSEVANFNFVAVDWLVGSQSGFSLSFMFTTIESQTPFTYANCTYFLVVKFSFLRIFIETSSDKEHQASG